MNDISDYVSLVQPVDTAGNVNHAVIIIGYWMYDSNYKTALPLIKESMDTIIYLYKNEKGAYAEFKEVYYDVRYVNSKAKPDYTE